MVKDEEEGELDIMRERVDGTRRSKRKRSGPPFISDTDLAIICVPFEPERTIITPILYVKMAEHAVMRHPWNSMMRGSTVRAAVFYSHDGRGKPWPSISVPERDVGRSNSVLQCTALSAMANEVGSTTTSHAMLDDDDAGDGWMNGWGE